MIAGTLRIQQPKPGKPMAGMMTASKDGLYWWTDSTAPNGTILATLKFPEIVSASSHGILFRGYEPKAKGALKYQEWWITPTKGEA